MNLPGAPSGGAAGAAAGSAGIACMRPPVIVIGAPRSGTTMLARLLARMGLFLGHKRVDNEEEAAYFHEANRQLIKRAHGYWDHPAAMTYLLRNSDAVEGTARCLAADAQTFRILGFMGWRRYFRYGTLAKMDEPWGWKDPVTSVTLPLWLKVFPHAKVVRIVRHGVDVAASLRKMEERVIALRQSKAARFIARFRYPSALQRWSFKGAARCLVLDGAFSLWEEFITQSDDALAAYAGQKLTFRYEDLTASPREHLMKLCEFCGLNVPAAAQFDELVATIAGDRASAFQHDPELAAFFETVRHSPVMQRYGYSTGS